MLSLDKNIWCKVSRTWLTRAVLGARKKFDKFQIFQKKKKLVYRTSLLKSQAFLGLKLRFLETAFRAPQNI